MKIYGLQKLTLADYPGKVAATLFTGGCNLRCPFCHNASLVTKLAEVDPIPLEEVLSYLKKRSGILDGVCVSGGEPLLQGDICELLEKLKSLGLSVKLDTNGTFPDKLEDILSRGLCDYVAMDIKNAPEDYALTVGIPGFDLTPVFKSVELLKAGPVPFEFRTTVVSELHSDDSIERMAKAFGGRQPWYLQCFTDSGDIVSPGLSAPSREDMERYLAILRQAAPNAALREM